MVKWVCDKKGVHDKRGVHGKWGRHGRGHVWQRGMHDMGACVAGGVHGRGAWQLVHGRGYVWQGGHAWQEREPLQLTIRILLECILILRASISNFIHVS